MKVAVSCELELTVSCEPQPTKIRIKPKLIKIESNFFMCPLQAFFYFIIGFSKNSVNANKKVRNYDF